MIELLKAEEAVGHRIVAMVVADVKGYAAKVRRIALPATWEVLDCTLTADFSMFRFVEYAMNRAAAARVACLRHGVNALYAYDTMASAVINAFKGAQGPPCARRVRCRLDVNYHQGLRRRVRAAYNIAQAPLRDLWLRDLRAAASRSRLIGDSKFVAGELGKLALGRPVGIQYPKVDVSDLRADRDAAAATQADPKGVVVIGDNVPKGGDIARRVAARPPARHAALPVRPRLPASAQRRQPALHAVA